MIPFWRGKVFVYSFMILLADLFAFKTIHITIGAKIIDTKTVNKT
jgi:hypothetical protein